MSHEVCGQRDRRIYEPFLNVDILAPSTLSLSEPTFTVTATLVNISPALFQAFTLQNATASMPGWTEGESYFFYDSEGNVPAHEVSKSSRPETSSDCLFRWTSFIFRNENFKS